VVDIADASDLSNVHVLTNIVRRYYVCWAKDLKMVGKALSQ
jgi:hypothetical protein